ncbi:MAG: hypothetical protein Hals2KO_20260 [Halioglobus sp.]
MNLQVLLAEREISRNIMAIASAMDGRDWPALAGLLAEDVTADFGAGEVTGAEHLVAYIRSFLDNCGPTQHLIGNVVVDCQSAGDNEGDAGRAERVASSRCYVCDTHLSQRDDSDLSFRTLGEYRDEWVCRDGRWLLARRDKNNRATMGSMAVFEP